MQRDEFIASIKADGFLPCGNELKAIQWSKPKGEKSGIPESWFIRDDEGRAVHYSFVGEGHPYNGFDKVQNFDTRETK